MYKNCKAVVSKANDCLDKLRTLLFDPEEPYCSDDSDGDDSDDDGSGSGDDAMEEASQDEGPEGTAGYSHSAKRNRKGKKSKRLYAPYDAHTHLRTADALAGDIADIPAYFAYEPLVEWVRKVLRFMGCLPDKLFSRVQLIDGEEDNEHDGLNEDTLKGGGNGVISYTQCCELLSNPDAAAVSNVVDSVYSLMETIGMFEARDGESTVVNYNPSLNPIVRHAESAYEFLRKGQTDCKAFMTRGNALLRVDYSRRSVGDIANAIDDLQAMIVQWGKMAVTPEESLLSDLQSTLLHLECSLKDGGPVAAAPSSSSSSSAAAAAATTQSTGRGAEPASGSGGRVANKSTKKVRGGKTATKPTSSSSSSGGRSSSSVVVLDRPSSVEYEVEDGGLDDQAYEAWMNDVEEAPDDVEADQ
jgi:hypothetical protein